MQTDLARIGQTLGETDALGDQDGTIIKQTELGKKLIHQLRTFKNVGLPKEDGDQANGDNKANGDHVNGYNGSAPNVENGKNVRRF